MWFRFVIGRLAATAGLLVCLSLLAFWLQDLAPGDTARIIGGPRASPAVIESIRDEYNLDSSFVARYFTWLGGALQLDFGVSAITREPVLDTVRDRLGTTLWLSVYAFLLAILIGIPLGILSALKRGTAVDRGIVGVSVLGVSAPPFATALVLIFVFGVTLNWFPVFGEGTGFTDRVYHLTLPAVAIALGSIAYILKLTRAAMADVLTLDYVTFARARGISGSRVLVAYGLRNALIPIVTASGLLLAGFFVGTLFVEVTFGLNGVGQLLVTSVRQKDVPVIQALILLIAGLIVLVNLVADMLYVAIDPRIRLGAVTD